MIKYENGNWLNNELSTIFNLTQDEYIVKLYEQSATMLARRFLFEKENNSELKHMTDEEIFKYLGCK